MQPKVQRHAQRQHHAHLPELKLWYEHAQLASHQSLSAVLLVDFLSAALWHGQVAAVSRPVLMPSPFHHGLQVPGAWLKHGNWSVRGAMAAVHETRPSNLQPGVRKGGSGWGGRHTFWRCEESWSGGKSKGRTARGKIQETAKSRGWMKSTRRHSWWADLKGWMQRLKVHKIHQTAQHRWPEEWVWPKLLRVEIDQGCWSSWWVKLEACRKERWHQYAWVQHFEWDHRQCWGEWGQIQARDKVHRQVEGRRPFSRKAQVHKKRICLLPGCTLRLWNQGEPKILEDVDVSRRLPVPLKVCPPSSSEQDVIGDDALYAPNLYLILLKSALSPECTLEDVSKVTGKGRGIDRWRFGEGSSDLNMGMTTRALSVELCLVESMNQQPELFSVDRAKLARCTNCFLEPLVLHQKSPKTKPGHLAESWLFQQCRCTAKGWNPC